MHQNRHSRLAKRHLDFRSTFPSLFLSAYLSALAGGFDLLPIFAISKLAWASAEENALACQNIQRPIPRILTRIIRTFYTVYR